MVKSQGLLVLGVGVVLATDVQRCTCMLSMCLSSFCPCISLIGKDCICTVEGESGKLLFERARLTVLCSQT